MKKHLYITIIILFTLTITSCTTDNEQNKENGIAKSSETGYKNMNVTILIDLSDRISASKNPGQAEKDIKSIGYVVDAFKYFMSKKGTINSDDKIRVIFYPSGDNKLSQEIAENLTVDFSKLEVPQKRAMFSGINRLYREQLERLYAIASRSAQYKGSDIFNYFKHRVYDDCITNDENYSDVLVILTDGYLFSSDSKYRDGNRFSFIGPSADHLTIFRNSVNWEKTFNDNNYGFINTDNNLSNLKILALEIAPIVGQPKDFDVIKKYWSKWFEEQYVKSGNYKIVKTDLPSLNKEIIYSFINKSGN